MKYLFLILILLTSIDINACVYKINIISNGLYEYLNEVDSKLQSDIYWYSGMVNAIEIYNKINQVDLNPHDVIMEYTRK